MRAFMIGLVALAVAGCTTPPAHHAVTNETLVSHPRTDTWQRLVSFAASRQMSVTIANEPAGILQAALSSGAIASHVDCGSTHSVTLPDPQGTVTIELADTGADTKAIVRVTATDRMFQSSGEIVRAPCTSRGTLEQEIFAALR